MAAQRSASRIPIERSAASRADETPVRDPMPQRHVLARRFGTLALVGIAAFVLACAAAQFLRTDLDWLRAPLSFYLVGPFGGWVQTSYFALALALISLGTGYYVALAHTARSAAPLLLFVLAALSLGVTATAHTGLPHQSVRLENVVHGIAAASAFLCVTTAMLLQSWRLRGDLAWRKRFRPAMAWSLICFVALWTDFLGHIEPRGLTQKVLIAMIVGWLALAALWLRARHSVIPAQGPAPSPAAGRPAEWGR